jgi:formate hydrogenlyase transcriptional activator
MRSEAQIRADAVSSERQAFRSKPAADPLEPQRLLLDVLRSSASHHDLGGLLEELTDVLQRVARFDRLAVVLHDAARDVMQLHSIGALNPVVPTVIELPPPETPSGIAWLTQQPVVVPNIDRESRFPAIAEFLRAEGMRSLCILPLTTPLRRLGALGFSSREEDAFREADVEFLQHLANHVAVVVDNNLHHQAAEQAKRELGAERDRLRLLLEINNALVSNLEPRRLFSAISSCVKRVVSHDYMSLALLDAQPGTLRIWALEFAGKGLIQEQMVLPYAGSPAGAAFEAATPKRFESADLARLAGEFSKLLLEEGIQSICCVPLTVGDRRLGTLNVGRLGGERFTEQDAEMLAAVANQVAFSVENALAFQEIAALKDKLAAEKIYLEEEIRSDYDFEEIIGDSPALKEALRKVETVAATDSTVLILGETGTGKELVARAIHDRSPRRERTLVKMNCASIPTGLLESELFGHERGAFTGAIGQKIGRFELADGGTIFLDEVGDIPPELQPKLLRVLQEREFERLGATRTTRVNVRVVAATNRSLEEMVAAGTFRSDLYYRLNVFPIPLPSLRERRDDVPRLVLYFVQKFARRMSKRIESVPSEAMAALREYDWPGNVRELENAIERAVILTTGPVLQVPIADFHRRRIAASANGTLEAVEREAILNALRESKWVVGGPAGAATRLGLKRTTLQSRMEKLGIWRPTD